MAAKAISRFIALRAVVQRSLEAWCFACCTAILIIILYQVSARYFAHQPLVWAQGTCQLLLMHMVFLGAAMAFANRSHIAIDLFVSCLPEGGRRMMELVVMLFVDLLLAFYSYCVFNVLSTASGVYPNPSVPKWVFYLPVFIGAVLAWLIVTINFFESLVERPAPKDRGEDA